MPTAALRPCRVRGCAKLSRDGGYCSDHASRKTGYFQTLREMDKTRPSAKERGYDGRWAKYRKVFLAEHPLCVLCRRAGKLTSATVVDHIVPARGDMELFWDETNHQATCGPCNSRKAAQEGADRRAAKKEKV